MIATATAYSRNQADDFRDVLPGARVGAAGEERAVGQVDPGLARRLFEWLSGRAGVPVK